MEEAPALQGCALGKEGRAEGEYTEIKPGIVGPRRSMWNWKKKIRMEKNQLLLQEQTGEMLNLRAILKYLFLSNFFLSFFY